MSFATSERFLRTALLGVLALGLAACGSLRMDLPPSFLRLTSGERELKATTADDARLWVREFGDPEGGDIAFWVQALRYDLEARGYRHDAEAAFVRDAAGNAGELHRFSAMLDGREYGYAIAIFLPSPGLVRVAEFVAPRERFDELVPAVREALASLGG